MSRVEDRTERPVYSALCELCLAHNFKLRLVINEKKNWWHISVHRNSARFINVTIKAEDIEMTSETIIETFKEKGLWQ